LKYYIERKDFDYAKKDPDPRVFPIYLKIVNNIEDDDFNTLTEEQKKEFVFGKVLELTYEQLEFAKNTNKVQEFNFKSIIVKISSQILCGSFIITYRTSHKSYVKRT
jgi:hypothetical protein